MSDCLTRISEFNEKSHLIAEAQLREEEFSAHAEHLDSTLCLGAYRIKQISELHKITQSITEEEKTYDYLSAQLGDLFSEQKAYEITIDDLKKKQLAHERQEESQFFDEVAMQKWGSK